MATRRVKCPCGAIVPIPERRDAGAIVCPQCDRKLNVKAAPTPDANKAAPAAKPKSKAWILLLSLGAGGMAAMCACGIVGWLALGWINPSVRVLEKDGRQAVVEEGKPIDKNTGKAVDIDKNTGKVADGGAKVKVETTALNTSYVTKDFGAAIIVSPSAVLQAPWTQSLIPQPWLTMARQAIGIDPLAVEQVIVLIETPPAVAAQPAQPVLADLTKHRPQAEKALKGHTFDIRSTIFSNDGKWLLTGSADRNVRIYDPRTGALIRTLPRFDDSVRSIALSPDKKSLAIASWDKTVRLWSFKTDSAKILPTGAKEEFEAVAISPDGKTLAAGGRSKSIYVFDLPEGGLRHTLPGHANTVTHLAFPRDSKTLVSYGIDNEVRVWDPNTGKALGAPVKQAFGDAMAISPDGKYVALGGFDNAIHVHDLATGKEIKKLNTQTGVRSLDFRFDGKVLAAGGGGFQKDGEVSLWKIPEGILLHDLHVHKKEVYAVAFSPDGSRLVSAGQDDFAQVWSLSPSADAGDPLPASMAFIVRLKNPKDARAVFAKATKAIGPFQEMVVDGKTLLIADNPQEPGCAYIAADGTIVIAPLGTLRKMIAGKKETSPLIERLAKLPAGDAQIIVSVEPYRKMLTEAGKEMKDELPPQLAGVFPLVDRLHFLELTLDLKKETLARLSFEMADDASATQCQKTLHAAIDFGKTSYVMLRESLALQVPPESAPALLALTDQAYTGVTIVKDGSSVTMLLKRPEIAAPPPDLIASSGFNNAKGMNAKFVPDAPFPLDANNRLGGLGESGWAGPWTNHQAATFQKKVVFEGDGALHLTGARNFGPNYGRQFAPLQKDTFQVEYYLQTPEGSVCGTYLWQGNGGADRSGPNWNASGGRFRVMDGDENGGGPMLDTGLLCEPGKWHKVTLRVDPAKRRWDFFVDDKQFLPSRALGFRTKVDSLDVINFLVEGGVYIDAVRISRFTGEVGNKIADINVAKVDPKKDSPFKEKTDDPKKDSPFKEKKDDPQTPVRPAGWPAHWIAVAGFNDAKGMNSNPKPDSPYPLNKANLAGGVGEFGWAAPWPAHPSATFQSKVAFEGDGALHLTPTPNVSFARQLAEPLRGVFQIEQHIQVPEGGSVTFYLNDGNRARRDGPVWQAQNGRFEVIEAGVPPNTGIACQPGKWHKVTVQVDVPKKQWSLLVDDKRFEPGQPLKFLSENETQFDTLVFWSHNAPGIYLDAVHVSRLPDDTLAKAFAAAPPVRPTDWPASRVASAGFNNAKGMNSTARPGVPHLLDKANVPGGNGEFGWAGPWNANEKIIFQSKEVFEGDGAAHVLPRSKSLGLNMNRRSSAILTEPCEVTQHIKIPPKGGIKGYITSGEANNLAGPVWTAEGGYFGVLDGNEKGGGKAMKFGKVDPMKWHKVTIVVDPQKRKWDFLVDDQMVRAGIGFRYPIQRVQVVDYLSEAPDGFYLDAVVIEKKK